MPYKYIGRKHSFKGKTLWEILGNLKNMGIGRIITRTRDERYPEPSFIKVLKVEPLPRPEEENIDNLRKVRVLVEKTFRGKTFPKPVLMERTTYKTDYQLIPKDEEESFCKRQVPEHQNVKILPKFMEFPPLLRELIMKDAKLKDGEVSNENLQLEIKYNSAALNHKYKIAQDGEKPTVTYSIGLGKPISMNLYKGIDLEDK